MQAFKASRIEVDIHSKTLDSLLLFMDSFKYFQVESLNTSLQYLALPLNLMKLKQT